MAAAPVIDPRSYQELVDETLARIPVHNPEWTNFNRSDPGVTLVELFAFLTEAHIYRANLIPERSRRKFLSLLGVPIAAASSARGLVAFANERGPLETVTVDEGLEVRAGQVPFRTRLGIDILPVEGQAFVKQPLPAQPDLEAYYLQLYASHRGQRPELKNVQLYKTTPIAEFGQAGAALPATADGSLWIALLLRASDPPTPELRRQVREQLAGHTVGLGIVPVLADPRARVGPGVIAPTAEARLDFQIPQTPPGGLLPPDPKQRVARYRSLVGQADVNVLTEPGVVQVALPDDPEALRSWENFDPLESGAADFPPSLEETTLADRLVTWLRIKVSAGAQATLLWAGINAAPVSQRARAAGETLAAGTGEPDQSVRLARTPVVAGTVTIEVTPAALATPERWHEIDELFAAGSEVAVRDPRDQPGAPTPPQRDANVFVVDYQSGEVRFGDGVHGRRPPAGAVLRADYDFGAGAAGNVGPGSISLAPALPTGIKVSNPVPTWGGAEEESVAEAEKQAARYLQHRDRLVTEQDFEAIVRRTPGIEAGRVEVLPTFNPQLAPPAPTPGAVTVLVIPRYDALHPDAPEPDRLFLDAICRYIDPRRLVTTEVFLRGPEYVDVWVSIGIEVEAGRSIPTVREDVRRALARFLAPIDPEAPDWFEEQPATLADDLTAHPQRGWPLGKPVQRLELIAVASRVAGVRLVNGAQLAGGTGAASESVPIAGLQLPRARAISVGATAADLDQLRGQQPDPDAPPPSVVPVPVIPETC